MTSLLLSCPLITGNCTQACSSSYCVSACSQFSILLQLSDRSCAQSILKSKSASDVCYAALRIEQCAFAGLLLLLARQATVDSDTQLGASIATAYTPESSVPAWQQGPGWTQISHPQLGSPQDSACPQAHTAELASGHRPSGCFAMEGSAERWQSGGLHNTHCIWPLTLNIDDNDNDMIVTRIICIQTSNVFNHCGS